MAATITSLFLYGNILSNNVLLDGSFEEAQEVFSRYDPRIWGISLLVILLFILEAILIKKGFFRIKSRNAKRVEKAERLGHVVTAVMDGREDYYQPDDPNPIRAANYVYEIEGRQYKYRYVGHDAPTRTITLYYINNPKKTFCRTASYVNLGCVFAFLPLIIGVALVYFMGIDINV